MTASATLSLCFISDQRRPDLRYAKLSDWLEWQEKLHPVPIDLGLGRVRRIAENCDLLPVAPPVITVAGTNGKGSTVAILESLLRTHGFQVASYTSPHLLHYNERICINGIPVNDHEICSAFDVIDRKRYGTSLSFFEFGTLAALYCFRRSVSDVVILEAGLGGRLDAVNIVEPAVSIITSIGIDHTEWLGYDRETIAREKAGIMRAGKPVICGDPDPPATIAEKAREVGAVLYRQGSDFHCTPTTSGCRFRCKDELIDAMPRPSLFGQAQLRNAAASLMALSCLSETFPSLNPIDRQAVSEGLTRIRLQGRFQIRKGPPTRIFDIAHNPDATEVLAENLREAQCEGKTHAVFAVLADKDVRGILRRISPLVDHWHLAEPDTPRALRLDVLDELVREHRPEVPISTYVSVSDACRRTLEIIDECDRLVVFGSVVTVAEAFAAGI